MNFPIKIELKNLSYKNPEQEVSILDKITFKIFEEDFILVIGGNGSGKTSLFKILQQLINPTSGQIIYKKEPINDKNSLQLKQEIVCIDQYPQAQIFPSLTIKENFTIWNMRRSKEKNINLKEYLKQFNPNLSDKLNQPCKTLSGGELQSLCLALAFIHPPLILLLDEHTSALDEKNKTLINHLTLELIKKYKTTCLMITHNLEDVEKFGNRIIALRDGKIILDVANDKTINSKSLLKACF